MRLKKIPYEYFLLWIQIVIITFFVLLLSAFYIKAKGNDFFENGLYSTNVQGFQIKAGQAEEVALQELIQGIDDETLFRYISEDNHIRRGYYSDKSDYFPFKDYIEKGRFFEEEDFTQKRNVVVIGCEAAEDTFEQAGKMVYGYNGMEYEVVGVFKRTNTDFDKVVYINLLSLFETEDIEGLYYVDGSKQEENEELVKRLIDTGVQVEKVNYENQYEDMNSIHKIKFILAVIAALCNLLMISVYFSQRQKYKIAVYKLCGIKNKEIGMYYAKRLGLLATFGYLAGCLLLLVCKNAPFISFEQTGIINYILTLCIICTAIGLVIYQMVRTLRQTDISSSLKGGV